jgi:uncharacterized protein DUF3857/transglutaminase superfamily protein
VKMLAQCLVVLVACLVAAGCAHTPVNENLALHQGEPIEGAQGVTFDGTAFRLPDGTTIPRDDVKKLSFQRAEQDAGPSGDSQGEKGLSPEAQAMLERGRKMAEQFPGVGGVILLDDGQFIYRKDGTTFYRYHFAGLVLKEDMKAWAQFSSGFTEGRSRVNVVAARSVAPDGTVHTLPPEALRVASPSEGMQFFNPSRKSLSGVIPGVEVGSVVEYIYEYDNYNPEDSRLFVPGYYFQSTEPVVFSRVAIDVPKDITFNYMTRHFGDDPRKEPVIEKTGKTARYTWTVEEVPPLVQEPRMPPQSDIVPKMEGSIFKSFEDVFSMQRDLQLSRMKLTPEIQAKVDEITAGAGTSDEKLARIYHWVQENTRYISIKGSLGSGLSGHTAQETFENRYGDCTDKAILFGAMCKAVGVTSYPIILTTNDSGTGVTEIPTLDGNHCISEVIREDGSSMYLDSTAQNFRYPYFRADDHGAIAVNSVRGDLQPIPVPPPSDNQRDSKLDVVLAANGDVLVKTRNRYNGNTEAGIRSFWKRVREDERALRMTEYVNSINPGAVLTDFTLSDVANLSEQLAMSIDYALPGHAIRAKDLMYMRVPTLERDYPEVALDTRRFPIQYMTTEERLLAIDIHLPKNFRAKWLPPPLKISSAYLEYDGAYKEADGIIRFHQTFRRLKRKIPAEDYPAYRDALRAIAAFSKKEIFVTEEG